MRNYGTTVLQGSSDWSINNICLGEKLAAANKWRCQKSDMPMGCQPRVQKEQSELSALGLGRYTCRARAYGLMRAAWIFSLLKVCFNCLELETMVLLFRFGHQCHELCFRVFWSGSVL